MDENQWVHFYNKGTMLWEEYEQGGNAMHLSEAIMDLQEALSLCPHDHYYFSSVLDNLGLTLKARYDREGHADDLILAIAFHEEALHLRPVGHPSRSTSLNNLALALRIRYKREGNVDDLSLSITHHQEALSLRPTGHPDRSTTLNNLGLALMARYDQEGHVDDLSLAIAYHHEALPLFPVEHPGRPAILNNLGLAFSARYGREGNVDDLSRAIAYNQEALDLCPVGHTNRSSTLINLAVALQTRYNLKGNVDDLAVIMAYNQEALALCPVGHPSRSATLDNLAISLKARYEREGNVDDLSLAIAYHDEDLTICPVGDPGRSITLYDLALALRTRYDRERNVDDLAHTITYLDQALDLRPPGHPLRSQTLRLLATSCWTARNILDEGTANHSGIPAAHLLGSRSTYPQIEGSEPSSIDHNSPDSLPRRIIFLLREASQSENCSPRDWLWATLDWIEFSKIIDPESTMEAYSAALHQLDIVLALGQSLEQRQHRLLTDDLVVKTRGLGDDAATWALQRGKVECAIEFLEQGRSLLLAQLGRYRTDLDDLYRVDSRLAGRFEYLSRRLDASIVSTLKIEDASSVTVDPYERYRRVSTEWSTTVDYIRTLPNFERFLKPALYEQLKAAASEGPIIIIIPNDNCCDALILRENEPIHRVYLPLANSDRLADISDNFIRAFGAEGHSTEKLCSANLKYLWNDVVEPIARALQQELGIPLGSRIWWYPTSMTSFLPLHAAGLYSKRPSGKNFPDLYISSFTPTLQALLRARRDAKASGPKGLLIVAQPATPGKSPLRCATEEAAVIKEIVSPIRDVETLSAEASTCEAVQRQMESRPWMHFICHGIQVEGQPLNSYLALHDGALTLRMIIQQHLPNAEFAFLSACHSAAGDKVLANEALHLAAAMQFAGFRGVVGTLWEMADENGPPLAETFYREMIKHGDSRGAAKALSEAIKQLRRNRVPLNLWMRFVHIGI